MTGAMSTSASAGQGRAAILHPPGGMGLGPNPFGKDVANLQLWQALARHGGYARLDVLTLQPADLAEVTAALSGGVALTTEITTGLLGYSSAPQEAGVLIRGQPELADIAWMRRRRASDRAYSLVGQIHTLAPPAMRQIIAAASVSPMHPWDALICTSPAVREGLETMFDGWGRHLAERTAGRPPPRPMLPVIPLGVDAGAFAAVADRPGARATARVGQGVGDDDILVLWVGRLSFFEKAFPQPMFQAVQAAQAKVRAQGGGGRIVFLLAGWFPNESDRTHFEAAARARAPDVDVRFVDGNDRPLLDGLWAGADVFLSLVDNIQETFGITPLEAMAAGLPVVASDWDGYRSTVRHGSEGFLVPTLGGPIGGGLGARMVERHTIEGQYYQAYVGGVAQHTAVHIGRAADAIAELAASPDLRRRIGEAGRRRVAEAFDWPVVARMIHDLTDELAAVRAASADPVTATPADPVKGDPFRDFAHFATATLTLEMRLVPTPGATPDTVRAAGAVALDTAFSTFRAPPDLCAQALALLIERQGATVREILAAFPEGQRRSVELGLAWMAKYGFVDWLT